MDEVETVEGVPGETVGETLRAAREAQGKSVEDIAAATRIPTRHLESLEVSDWDRLPAPTYSIGFAKAYAGEVGLDRATIGERLREELGGYRPPQALQNDYFAPTDPKRTIPLGMVAGAILAIALLALGLTWLLNRDISAPDNVAATANEVAAEAPVAAATAQPAVVLTASQAVWVDIRDGATVLKQGELLAGQSFEVPTDALAPTLSTARPEALRIAVGTADAPPLGPPGVRVSNVSLKGEDLLRPPAPAPAANAGPQPAPVRTPTPSQRRRDPAPTADPAPAPVQAPPPPPPVANSAG